MDFFDLHTAYLIMGSLYFTMPVAVWLALRHHRSPAVHAWCGGGLLFGLGLTMLSQRNHWPAWMTFELANLFIHLGQLARVQALRLELQRPLSWPLVFGLPVGFLGIYELGLQSAPPDTLAYGFSLVCMAAYFAWISRLSMRIAREQRLISAYWLGAIYLPMLVLVTLHGSRVLLGLSESGPLHSDWGSVTIALVGNLTAVIGNTSFLGLYLERAAQRQLISAREQARTAENARLGQEIGQLERLRSMGLVTTNVIHELSQPLTNIQLLAEHAELDARQRPHDSVALREHVGQILQQSRHAAQVLQRVRHFIAPRQTQRQILSLQQVNTQVQALLGDWLRSERVVLEWPAASTPVYVMGDEVHLSQVLVNLYRNAVEATAGQAERRIRVQISALGQQAQMLVRDNGPGLSPEALERVAQERSFFSTPADAKGLGVGLLICQKIVAQHQGQLRLYNHPNGGAVAELNLPLA